MKIKEYRTNLFKNYFRLMQAKQKVFLSDTRREASVKRIDLALDPELIFSEGIGALVS
jgi:hypothetical protein